MGLEGEILKSECSLNVSARIETDKQQVKNISIVLYACMYVCIYVCS